MLYNFYPIHSQEQLTTYLEGYVPLVIKCLYMWGIDLNKYNHKGDHLGLQVVSNEEFDIVDKLLLKFSKNIKEGIIHERRNNIYKLNDYIDIEGLTIQSIEMFEQKPETEISNLKPGIEHIAIQLDNYDDFKKELVTNEFPIDKSREMGNSKFLKTKFMNLIEVEFRNDILWESVNEQ